MKIKITADSTCDIPAELQKEKGISIIPLEVILGAEVIQDTGWELTQKIYAYEKATGKLPKTAARSSEVYGEFFAEQLESCDAIVHYSISHKCSASLQEAARAALKFDGKVFVIDGYALSTGTALLAFYGCDLRDKGLDAKTIYEESLKRVKHAQTSFIIDRLDYLYKGGRCSRLALFGANLLKIKPTIVMRDGALEPGKKFRGPTARVVESYVDYIMDTFNKPDLKRCFITHTEIDPEIVNAVRLQVAERYRFEEVIETVAGAVITSHCGKGTLGVLYINDGGGNVSE